MHVHVVQEKQQLKLFSSISCAAPQVLICVQVFKQERIQCNELQSDGLLKWKKNLRRHRVEALTTRRCQTSMVVIYANDEWQTPLIKALLHQQRLDKGRPEDGVQRVTIALEIGMLPS